MTTLRKLASLAARLITVGLLVVGMSLLVGLLLGPFGTAGHGAASISLLSLVLGTLWRLMIWLMPALFLGWLLSLWVRGLYIQEARPE